MRNWVFSWEPQHAREESCLCLLIGSAGILDHTPESRRQPQSLHFQVKAGLPLPLLCRGTPGAAPFCKRWVFFLRRCPFCRMSSSFTCRMILALGNWHGFASSLKSSVAGSLVGAHNAARALAPVSHVHVMRVHAWAWAEVRGQTEGPWVAGQTPPAPFFPHGSLPGTANRPNAKRPAWWSPLTITDATNNQEDTPIRNASFQSLGVTKLKLYKIKTLAFP